MRTLTTTTIAAAVLLAACGGASAPAAQSAPGGAPTAAPAAAASSPATAAPAATAAAAQTAGRKVVITADGEQYKPATIDVKAGETIDFVVTNKDEAKHNMVGIGDTAKLLSPDFEEGTTVTYRWTAPDKVGDIKVVCAYHVATSFIVKVLPKS